MLMENELIKKARNIPYIRWHEIIYLIKEASDDETKEYLKYIMTQKRLKEEITC